jgi:ribosomal-protein-alanine N-acetyltransferase
MQKIILRPATEEDAEFLFEMMQNKEFQKYFPSNLIAESLEDQKKKLRHLITQMKNDNGYYFIIYFGEQKTGIIDLYKIDRRNARAGIGYGIAKQYWQKGIATKAVKTALNFAKTKQKLHGLNACIDPKNIASKKVLRKCGFNKIGLAKEYDFEKGKYADRELYWKIL